jgi:NAD(P)-dependent dehydrogenase (short-subunit alcohol dehydrogenase family)
MADIDFKGKVAIVTGAGAGLGKTYALELAKRGCKVVVNDLGGARDGSGASHGPAQEVVDEIKKAGGEAAPNYDNVATIEGGQNIVKTAVDAFGKVDIVINNAGILRDKSFLKMEPDLWDVVVAVHLRGAYCVTQPAFAIMKEQNFGRVVLTTSGAGLYGNFGQTNYAAAKMGLIGLMNALKIEGAKYNIKINTIAPVAASRLTEDVMPPEFFAKLRPEFVTPIVTYLASEDCQDSGYIFNCGMGWYSRSAIVMGNGALIGDGQRDIKAEEIRDNWKKITDLSGAKEVGSVQETFGAMLPLIQK